MLCEIFCESRVKSGRVGKHVNRHQTLYFHVRLSPLRQAHLASFLLPKDTAQDFARGVPGYGLDELDLAHMFVGSELTIDPGHQFVSVLPFVTRSEYPKDFGESG